MDLRRLRAGEWIAGLGGAALLVSLFLPWYGGAARGLTTVTGWQSLAVLDVLLALAALGALALPVVTAAQRVPAVPIALASLVTMEGLLAAALVLVRVGFVPGEADGREWGLWLGLAGALAILAGGAAAMRDERLSRPGRGTDASGRPAPPPELDTIPAPRAEDGR